jgi:hypothetical protein
MNWPALSPDLNLLNICGTKFRDGWMKSSQARQLQLNFR